MLTSLGTDEIATAGLCISFLHQPGPRKICELKMLTRPEGLLDPKIRDEMSDFLEIFPTENQI